MTMSSVNDPKQWNPVDPEPAKALAQITPISRRARSLLVRNKTCPKIATAYLNVEGAVGIMEGLDYHHERFKTIVNAAASGNLDETSKLVHEAVAYANRIGLFYYFSDSDFVTQVIGGSALPLVPTIDRVTTFRHKVTAHRSIDKPRSQDTSHLQEVHALALMNRLFTPRTAGSGVDSQNPWKTGYVVYPINLGTSDQIELAVERDHGLIMAEAYDLMERILT